MLGFSDSSDVSKVITKGWLTASALIIVVLAGGAMLAGAQQTRDLDALLLQAVQNRDINSVHHLLEQGANINAKGSNGYTALAFAAEGYDAAMVELLLDRGADVRAKDDQGESALTHAAGSGSAEIVRLLLQKKSGRKEKDQALFAAAEGGPVVLQMQEEPNPTHSAQAATPLPESPYLTTVRLLLDNGAEVDARREDGSTPLIEAAAFARTDIVRLLLHRGASITATDKYGNTALIAAACECAVATMNSAYDVVKALLDKGAFVNARSRDGKTPLMNAAGGFGGIAIVKLLLANGADPLAKDNDGNTALTFARKGGRPDKARLLKAAIAKAQ